jgi:hypothetical protein
MYQEGEMNSITHLGFLIQLADSGFVRGGVAEEYAKGTVCGHGIY